MRDVSKVSAASESRCHYRQLITSVSCGCSLRPRLLGSRMAGNCFAVLTDQSGSESVDGPGKPNYAEKHNTTTLSAALKGVSIKQEAEKPAQDAAVATRPQRLPSTHKQPLVWVDLEMTGLDLQRDKVIEIACLITDGRLRDPVEGPNIAIHQPDEVLDSMNAWCVEHHGASGLTQRVRDSTISMQEAEEQVLRFVMKHVPEPKMALLAGNSVHVDLAFLRQCMPRLVDHLHYRIVDVSSIAEVCRRWCPDLARKAPRKERLHTALADIKESIQELQYYKKTCFKGLRD